MKQENFLKAIKQARENSKKRNFSQTFDLIINLKDIDLKKPEEKVDIFLKLPKPSARKLKVCALVDDERLADAKKTCDTVVHKDEFAKYAKSKVLVKKLAKAHSFFVTQPHLMPEVAKAFGRVLGPRGKMPNPKAGCIIPPKVPMEPIIEKLRTTVRLQTKNDKAVRTAVGMEDMKDEDIAENLAAVFNAVLAALPNKESNLVSVLLKLTMGAPAEVEK